MTFPSGCLIRDQRMSEIGYGRVLELRDDGFALVLFGQDPVREMRLKGHSDVIRARLHPGQTVEVCREGKEVTLAKISAVKETEEGSLFVYGVEFEGEEPETLSEAWLTPVGSETGDPLELLHSLDYRGPRGFFARCDLLRTLSLWYENSFGIPAFLGARITPTPHQIHAARRVLCDRLPRFVLADEVGLGKTIEAGLVIQALSATDPDLRVLVVAPGAMSRQWLCELFLRFGEQVFVHVDASRMRDEGCEDLVSAQRLIVSTTALEAYPELREAILAEEWDLVVIDEAHQVPPRLPLYGFLRTLAESCWGLLALSATPSKRDVEGLLGLLALVAPGVYDPNDSESLTRRLALQDRVTACLDTTLSSGGKEGDWEEILPGDAVIQDLVSRLQGGDEHAGDELRSYVQEYHRIDRRIIRTRRSTVRSLGTAICSRELEVLDYEASKSEVALVEHFELLPKVDDLQPHQRGLVGLYRRQACTTPMVLLGFLETRKAALAGPGAADVDFDLLGALGSDPGPAEEEHLRDRALRETPPLPGEIEWLHTAVERTHDWMLDSPDGCPRFDAATQWIKAHLKSSGKVLVFSQDREVVIELAQILRDELGPDTVGAIHHELDEQQLSEVALRFQQPGTGCRVLVSDELGGEGRNFQSASAILHLDQPWPVARLEQRIGRLDRMGRPAHSPVLSVALRGPSPTERALLRIHADVFDVYRGSLGGLEFALPELQRQISAAACQGAGALEELLNPLGERVKEERARVDEAYERALDSSQRRLDEAAEYAEILEDTDGSADTRSLGGWARRLGIKFKPIADDTWSLRWTWEHLRRPPPGLYPPELIPVEGRVRKQGTFSRTKALADESLEFFGPGHPLVDSLVRDLESQIDGRATVCMRDLGPERRGHCYLLLVARTELDVSAWEGADVSAGLLHRARTRIWPQARSAAVLLQPGKTVPAALVNDRKLLGALEGQGGGSGARKVDRDDLGRSVHLPLLWAAVEQGVKLALDGIRASRRAEVEEAAGQLREDFRDDLGFFRGIASRSGGEVREQALREVEARERLVEGVLNERAVVDALAIVVGS
jgi:ATP-dependent helicase HepA